MHLGFQDGPIRTISLKALGCLLTYLTTGWQKVWSTGSAAARKAKKFQDQIQFSNLKDFWDPGVLKYFHSIQNGEIYFKK